MADSTKGASDNERLLYAARLDDVDMLQEIFKKKEFDINYQDGQGNTALHYAALNGSTEILEDILTHDNCDVDPTNYTHKQTPLHLAVRLEDPDLKRYIVENLLEAGANMSIKDKSRLTALDYVAGADTETRGLFRKAQAANAVNQADIASDGSGEDGSEQSGDRSDDDED